MKKMNTYLLQAYTIALHEDAYSDSTLKLASELVRRGLGDQLEDAWVSYMAEREGVLEIGCEFDGKF